MQMTAPTPMAGDIASAAVDAGTALVLVNLGGASGVEILALAREVRDAVQARFGIELEPEPGVL